MARKSYLANSRKELVKIGGIGDFGEGRDPIEVSADIAHQYETPEARDEGWMVSHKEDAPAKPVPLPVAVPAPPPAPKPAPVPPATPLPKGSL